MTENELTIMAVGDLVVDVSDAAAYFAPSRDLLRSADLAVGHIEVPHTDSTEVATLAGNHAYDCGARGIADTIRHCRDAGMATTGTGPSLEDARRPAIVERKAGASGCCPTTASAHASRGRHPARPARLMSTC